MSNSPPAPITFISSQDFVFSDDEVEQAPSEPIEGGGRMGSTSTSSSTKGRMTGSANSRMNSKPAKTNGSSTSVRAPSPRTPSLTSHYFFLAFIFPTEQRMGSTSLDRRRIRCDKVSNCLVRRPSISRRSEPRRRDFRTLRLVLAGKLANGTSKRAPCTTLRLQSSPIRWSTLR